MLLQLLLDFVSVGDAFRSRVHFDVVLTTNLNPFIVLTKIRTKRLILVSGDNYVPLRQGPPLEEDSTPIIRQSASGRIASFGLVLLDKLLQNNMDEVWYLSRYLRDIKYRCRIATNTHVSRQVVPLATEVRIGQSSLPQSRDSVIYLGRVADGHGLDVSIKAMQSVIAEFPEATLHILGGGIPSYVQSLRRLARQLGLTHHVIFHGYVPNSELPEDSLYDFMAGFSVALAIYSHPQIIFTDPGKIKDYLSCGLPIVVSQNLQMAREITEMGAGIAVPYDAKAIADAINSILVARDSNSPYLKGAVRLASKYDYREVYAKAMNKRT
jgi:glycosyltransferase involved in cell wall biosynthesis